MTGIPQSAANQDWISRRSRGVGASVEALRHARKAKLVEHPFGTIKAWMGHTHVWMRRLSNVKTETSHHIPAYNMKRVMAVLGTKPLMETIKA